MYVIPKSYCHHSLSVSLQYVTQNTLHHLHTININISRLLITILTVSLQYIKQMIYRACCPGTCADSTRQYHQHCSQEYSSFSSMHLAPFWTSYPPCSHHYHYHHHFSLSLPLADCLHRPQRYSGIIETSSSNSFGGSIFLRLDYLHATEMELICIYSHLFIHIYIYIYSSY